MRIGVISDTHSFINPKVYDVFAGVDQILHAGDIGSEDVVISLEDIAPLQAVCGNIDTFPLSTRYPEILALEIEGVSICMLHQFISLKNSSVRNAVANLWSKSLDILIHGHSHEAKISQVDGVTLFNPGSAGKPRFSLRPAVGLLTIAEPRKWLHEIVYLDGR